MKDSASCASNLWIFREPTSITANSAPEVIINNAIQHQHWSRKIELDLAAEMTKNVNSALMPMKNKRSRIMRIHNKRWRKRKGKT